MDDVAARKQQIAAAFNRLAGDYDVAGPGCFAWFGQRLIELAGVEPGHRVLDVACGRGAVLIPAARRVGPDGTVVGIDLSETMLRLAGEEVARRGLTADLQIMDAEQLAFPDGTFDRVFCGFGLMFFPHVATALAEFRRVLSPRGLLGVSTWQVSQAEDLSAVLVDLGLADRETGWIADADALKRHLSDAGFSDVRVISDAHTFVYADLEQYWQNARGTGLRRWLDALDEMDAIRVRDALAERVASRSRPDGLHLDAVALLALARAS